MRIVKPPRFHASAQGLRLHRPRSPAGARTAGALPTRVSDLILAVLGVTLLGGLALTAACALAARV